MRKSVALLVIFLFASSGLAVVEVGPGVRFFQHSLGSNVNFSQDINFSEIGVRRNLTDFGDSNFTVNPESSSNAELDFYRPTAERQEYVSNFTARASPEQNVSFNITNLPSDDFYEAFISDTGSRIYIGYTNNDSSFNFSHRISNENISVFNYGEKGVEADGIGFNNSDPVEGNSIDLKVNISNEGVVEPEEPNVSVGAETFNGTQWTEKELLSKYVTIPENSSVLGNISWKVKPGPWRFNVSLDPNKDIKETNESNNRFVETLNVDSYQVLYGGSDLSTKVGANTDDMYVWNPENSQGFLYFADIDSNFDFSDLKPMDGSNFYEVDEALKMLGHNDSVQEVWDPNGDGRADQTRNWTLAGREMEVPVADSTSAGSFHTGILFDSSVNSSFTGSEDLVFVTKLKPATVGKFGRYDYEARIPFGLRSLKPGSDRVTIYEEVR